MYAVLDGTTVLPEPGAPERTDMSAVLAMYKALIAEPPKTAWLVATGESSNEMIVKPPAHTYRLSHKCCSAVQHLP